MLKIIQAKSAGEVESVRDLFREYALSVGAFFSIPDFEKELAGLPGKYAPPDGRLFLALCNNKVAGCVALKKTDKTACEMARLYVRPDFRDRKIGRALASAIVKEAKSIGYARIRLDTLRSFKEAVSLYTSLGFTEVSPCTYPDVEGAITMEKILK